MGAQNDGIAILRVFDRFKSNIRGTFDDKGELDGTVFSAPGHMSH
jgi:hypothetical protein